MSTSNTCTRRSSSGPDIPSPPFNPISQLINASVPLLQSNSHAVNLFNVQNLTLNPFYVSHALDLRETISTVAVKKIFDEYT